MMEEEAAGSLPADRQRLASAALALDAAARSTAELRELAAKVLADIERAELAIEAIAANIRGSPPP